eukprot:15362249-Ditylum_brightwellii.AAC.1
MVYASVNETAAKQAPLEAMVQLGQSIQMLVALMVDNYNQEHLFKFAKLDVKDGFWWLVVNEEDAWNVCYVLLPLDGPTPASIDDVELLAPMSIQMGWCESLSYFCTSSETSQDVM